MVVGWRGPIPPGRQVLRHCRWRGPLGYRLLLGGIRCLRRHVRRRQDLLRCNGKGVLRIIAADREATGVDRVVR